MSRIYLASSWRNEEQPLLVATLRDAGHEVYDFRNPQRPSGESLPGFSWDAIDPLWPSWTPITFREALNSTAAKIGFDADMNGMYWADTCVLLTPSGRSAHLEAGWMAGAGKRTLVLLRPGEPELMYKLLGTLCVSIEELVDELRSPANPESGPSMRP